MVWPDFRGDAVDDELGYSAVSLNLGYVVDVDLFQSFADISVIPEGGAGVGVGRGQEDYGVPGGFLRKHEPELYCKHLVHRKEDLVVHGPLGNGFAGGDYDFSLDWVEGGLENGGWFLVLGFRNALQGGLLCFSCGGRIALISGGRLPRRAGLRFFLCGGCGIYWGWLGCCCWARGVARVLGLNSEGGDLGHTPVDQVD